MIEFNFNNMDLPAIRRHVIRWLVLQWNTVLCGGRQINGQVVCNEQINDDCVATYSFNIFISTRTENVDIAIFIENMEARRRVAIFACINNTPKTQKNNEDDDLVVGISHRRLRFVE